MTNYMRWGQRVGLRPLEIEDTERSVGWVHDPQLTATLLLGRYPIDRWASRSGSGAALAQALSYCDEILLSMLRSEWRAARAADVAQVGEGS